MKKVLLALFYTLAFSGAGATDIYQVAIIPKGTTYEFWKSLHAGALKAEREFTAAGIPVHVIWKGSLREDDRDGQIQVVENFIGRQVNGIVLAPLDNRALVAPVRRLSRRSRRLQCTPARTYDPLAFLIAALASGTKAP